MTSGSLDFETVAAHELGHSFGFYSIVDIIDTYLTSGFPIGPTTLDLFQLRAVDTPTDTTSFTNNPRCLVPGSPFFGAAFTSQKYSDLAYTYAMSTGAYFGDGYQASHWKDSSYVSWIGIMDPALEAGLAYDVAFADIQALDTIGFDKVPLPPSVLLFGSGLVGILIYRRRRQV